MRVVANILLGGALGFIVDSMGYSVENIEFWAILAIASALIFVNTILD
jgi:hypothetical protein